jgi:SHS2 domain-containing protein
LSLQPTPAASHTFEDHTSELRLRVEAPTLVELFAEAGRALALLEHGNGPLPEPEGEAQPVSIRSRDRAALLVDWLNELIFRTEVEGKIFTDFRFERLTDRDLEAWIRGARAAPARTLVKAATLHNLTVMESSHGAFATVVLDV